VLVLAVAADKPGVAILASADSGLSPAVAALCSDCVNRSAAAVLSLSFSFSLLLVTLPVDAMVPALAGEETPPFLLPATILGVTAGAAVLAFVATPALLLLLLLGVVFLLFVVGSL
jgi:hypothetical protein